MSEKAAEEAEIRDRCLTEFFTRYDRGQAIREALPAILHDLLRARLEELVKGMPLSDGGLRLSGDVAQRVAVLTRMHYDFLEPADKERLLADADRLIKALLALQEAPR